MNNKSTDDFQPVLGPANSDAIAMMRVLDVVETRESVTQRLLAREVGIAVGLVNAYIKRCVRKGYLKTTKAPARRYAYYLTPKGFAEKSRLAASFFVSGFQFFRTARGQCAEVLADCAKRGLKRIVLCGTGDLCEVAIIAATEVDVTIVGIVDPDFEGTTFRNLPTARDLSTFEKVDAVIVTDMRNPQGVHDALLTQLPAERILAAPMLRIGRQRPKGRRR